MNLIDRMLSRFTRITSGGAFIPEIDGLRFFAIMSVVLYHLNEYLKIHGSEAFRESAETSILNLALLQGHFGVQLFFVISGFILAIPFAEHYMNKAGLPALGRYYKRRLTRLEPPYIVNIAVLFVFLLIIQGEKFGDFFTHFLASIVYLHNAVYGEASAVNGVAWSLEVEVQFYLLAPFLSLVFLLGNKWLRRSVIVAGILIFSYFFGGREYHIFLLGEIQYFLAGFLLADVFLVEWKKAPARNRWFDLVGIIVLAAMWFVATNRFYVKSLLPFLILVAYIAAFRGVFWNSLTRNRWLVVIGGMCYTIYLYHFQFVALLARTTLDLRIGQSYALNCFLQIALVVPLVVIASAFLFVALERPFMVRNWPSKLAKNIKAVIYFFPRLWAKGGFK